MTPDIDLVREVLEEYGTPEDMAALDRSLRERDERIALHIEAESKAYARAERAEADAARLREALRGVAVVIVRLEGTPIEYSLALDMSGALRAARAALDRGVARGIDPEE